MALGNTKCTKTIFYWTVYLFTSKEVGMKYIHCESSNLIGWFECTMYKYIYIYIYIHSVDLSWISCKHGKWGMHLAETDAPPQSIYPITNATYFIVCFISPKMHTIHTIMIHLQNPFLFFGINYYSSQVLSARLMTLRNIKAQILCLQKYIESLKF